MVLGGNWQRGSFPRRAIVTPRVVVPGVVVSRVVVLEHYTCISESILHKPAYVVSIH